MKTIQPDLAAAVDLARLAPSVHNTQPWRFRIDEDAITLSRDPERRLKVLDPSGRQQVISCGTALYLAGLALRQQGFVSVVTPFPPQADPDVLARVVPMARHETDAEDVALAYAARHRHTQREPFEDRVVSKEIVAELRAAANEFGAWVRIVDAPDDLAALTVLLSRGDEDEREDPAYREELAQWTARPASARDGLSLTATPDVHDRGSSLRLRDFRAKDDEAGDTDSGTGSDPAGDPPPAERPLALVLGTEQDTAVDWLRAGEALMALLLHAAVAGLQAQPLGQVVDRQWSRDRLGAALGVVGHPQMVLRVGYAMAGPDTPRRPLDEIVDR